MPVGTVLIGMATPLGLASCVVMGACAASAVVPLQPS